MAEATAKDFAVTPEQRAELRRRWVEALGSGKYPQGNGSLECDGKACCLGVACLEFDAMFPGQLLIKRELGYSTTFDRHIALMPEVVRGALGLTAANGGMGEPVYGLRSLIGLNDTGKTFPEIAAVIKSNPPGLFID